MANKEIRKTRNNDILRSEIREFISFSSCPTSDDLISRVRERDIDLKHIWKRNVEHGHMFGVSAKKTHSWSHCGKCCRSHDGVCKAVGSRYYKCGKIEHFRKDYTVVITTTQKSYLICFHKYHRVHKKANCPSLALG